jgi:hypothetical protein
MVFLERKMFTPIEQSRHHLKNIFCAKVIVGRILHEINEFDISLLDKIKVLKIVVKTLKKSH